MIGDPLTILLVEDNNAHAELVKRSFEQHRVANQVQHVVDGQQALDYLFRNGDYADINKYPDPHIVLLDLRLPKVDGLEVLKQIKSADQLHNLPVIILTTSSAEQDIAKAYDYNANSYVVKPMDYDKFTSLMDDLGFYWMLWNEYPWK